MLKYLLFKYNGRNKMRLVSTLFTLLITIHLSAQNSLITTTAKENLSTFKKEGNVLVGSGWDQLVAEAKAAQNILIGEDHFLNEVAFFTSQLADNIHFDNFICEIDPYSAKIIQEKISTLSKSKLEQYVKKYYPTFSFYSLEPEFALMKKLVKDKTNIIGTDQIIKPADRLIFSDLIQKSKSAAARTIYQEIAVQSKTYFANFLKNPKLDFYLETDSFQLALQQLSKMPLSAYEKEVIGAMEKSREIYSSRSHALRIQLMLHQLMEEYSTWHNKKNLFKYGAVHASSGESFLKIYDIGNLVHTISESQFQKSLHIIVLGKSGTQGVPFEGFPISELNIEQGYLQPIKPFFDAVEGENWHCFDLRPLAALVEKGELKAEHKLVERMIKGYDYLVIIPTVSAAVFPD